MLKYFLSIVIMVAAICCVSNAGAQPTYNKLATEVLMLINDHRATKGLRPLTMNDGASVVAGKHSSNMASGRVAFGHDGFDGRMAQLRKQIKPVNAWAENVAYGSDDAAEIVDMWLHSPGHKKNIEGDYNVTGIGIAKGKDGYYYYTQVFLKKE